MKTFVVILFFGFASISFAEPDCVDSVVFVKKPQCDIAAPTIQNRVQKEQKKETPFGKMPPAKNVLEQAIADKMLVFATNTQPTFSGLQPTEKFGIVFDRASVRLGIRKSF